MEEKQSKADLLALRGGLRGRFRRVFDGMENAFEVLLDQLEHPLSPADRAGMAQLVQDMQTQLLGARRLGDQASDAATAAVLHSTCVPRPIDLLSWTRSATSCGRRPPGMTCRLRSSCRPPGRACCPRWGMRPF